MIKKSAALAAAALFIFACTTNTPAGAADTAYDVLVFSKTAGFRHDSIAVGTQAIRDLGAVNNFTVTATEDANAFTTANLAQYEAVVFLNTTGDVLDDAQQTAFESYIRSGGGYVGVHSAADTEYAWPFYGELMGAWFASHPAIQQATIRVEDRGNAATASLPQAWVRTDEWYNYQTNPRSTAHVLASLDETSYSGGTMGDHPHTWCKTVGNGRSFYTGGGHTQSSYSEGGFRALLLGGIRYAARKVNADCRPEGGYTPLYNGSLTGWSQAGPGSFTNSDATLTTTGGMGLLWYSAQQFTNYSLKVDWQVLGDDNSGIFVGFPASSDPTSAVNSGYEIQIDATDTPDRTTGAIYGFQSADIAARDAALNPPGSWNTFDIQVSGERIQVYLNGVKINDFTNTDPNRSLPGYVGLQNHGAGDDVLFRNVRIATGTPTAGPIQAESFSSAGGVQPFTKAGAHNGQTLGFVDPGDWAAYNNVDLTGVNRFQARVVSGGPGGTVQVRTGSPTGPLLGSVAVPNTGGWTTFADVSTGLSGVPTGAQTLYLTFTGTGTGLFDVDDFTLSRVTGAGRITGIGGKCVDVSGAATADGTKIQLWTCNGSSAQQWTAAGQTWRALGKCLDVSGGAGADGTKVQLWTCNGTGAQNWAVQTDGSLRNPQSGKCLDAAGGATADGTQLQIWTCNGGANQKWVLP